MLISSIAERADDRDEDHHRQGGKPGTQVSKERQLTYRLAQAALDAGEVDEEVTDLVSVALPALTADPPARAHAAAKARPGGATLIGLTLL
jgi:hypothetical protein